MPIAKTIERYLDERGVPYDVVPHPRAFTSMETAANAHVAGDQLAKSVLLRDGGEFVLAVVPATHWVELAAMEGELHRHLELASEDEIARVFPDCERGAVPAVGPAYGLETVLDETLTGAPDVYFEAGDHVELVHLRGERFRELMAEARAGRISRHV